MCFFHVFYLSDNKYISGNLDFQKLSARTDDTANDSDTATDILLAQDGTGARGESSMRYSVVRTELFCTITMVI